ncbi:hypothetical protein [Litorihabitans aurantiacus]|uniref:Uncharacterized protein n=1 Tax=Litorihabitans aurantiacus TaxID=1930061 RepID=A0AA37XFY1_9MICO|nr:hypothetical protein [Litorihabitans aurantiacus]GMA32344.1 hypothetical protein GCM10025875_23360 [Litorihabitans aurantiacus]
MFSDWKRRRTRARVKPGDGHALQRYRWWQPFSRSLLHLDLREDDGSTHRWSVDVRLWGDRNGEMRADLFRDGRHHATSRTPARFPVPGGDIEVVLSSFGLRRCHYVDATTGLARQLTPDAASAEGRRARLQRRSPGLSTAIGAGSVVILLVALVLGLPQLAETITSIPPVAERVGEFTSPIDLPGWFNTGLVVAAALASTERALRLRYHWLLDGGGFDEQE